MIVSGTVPPPGGGLAARPGPVWTNRTSFQVELVYQIQKILFLILVQGQVIFPLFPKIVNFLCSSVDIQNFCVRNIARHM